MKKIIIKNRKLEGGITPPPSKSILHRCIIAASFANGVSKIKNINLSKDILATINAMKELGANIKIEKNSLTIDGRDIFFISFPSEIRKKNIVGKNIKIDCNESGSTLRFLIPISLIKKNKVEFIGKDRLFKRPLTTYFRIFDEMNIKYNFQNKIKNSLLIDGELRAGIYKIKGDISSQFITGLLFSLPLLKENSKIIIENKLESKSYIDLTLDYLTKFGIKIINNNYEEFIIEGNQQYTPQNIEIESDYSQAAFFLVANSINSKITIKNMNLKSKQGDKKIIEFLKEIEEFNKKNETLYLDARDYPDIVPILSLKCAISDKRIEIVNIGRLRIKECDRLKATVDELSKLGFDLIEKENSILINSKNKTELKNIDNIELTAHNDHRIAMLIAIASTIYKKNIILDNADCVEKSYPNFWQDFLDLGGEINEYLGK